MGQQNPTVTLDDATLPAPDGFGRGAAKPSPVPQNIGRFIVLSQLGEGGMGSVLEAHDEALERRVAIKVLHRKPLPGHESRHSLRREAQVLARLSHPNVVHVYEVGEHQGQVFLVMELIRGGTLREWTKARPRRFDEIRDVMCAAGRGLRAAHEQGLVHRDFKPDNVLVGTDGRPRVVDFGLARTVVSETLMHPRRRLGTDDPTPSARSRMAGTVPYMAPEQLLGMRVDARTDQFAFCVALYELVYGRHPFASNDPIELTMRIVDGDFDPVPRGGPVPAGLEAVLVRGLQRRPEHRYPHMGALLEELEAVDRRRRPSTAIVGAAATLMGLGVVASVAQPTRSEPCGDGRVLVEQLWDGPRRDRMRDSFVQGGFDYAGTTWVRLRDHLDTYASRWVGAHQQACHAEPLASPEAEALLDRRMECLGARLRGLHGLLDVLEHPDASTVERSVTAAMSLAPVEDCANPSMLPAVDEEPVSPDDRAAVARAREELAAVRALLDTGKVDAAGERLDTVAQDTEPLALPSLDVEVLALRGELAANRGELAKAELLLADAFWIAEGRGFDPRAVDAGVMLVNVVGDQLQRFDDGLAWYRHARGVAERAGIEGLPLAWLVNNRGNILFKQGRFAAAIDAFQTAASIAEQHASDLALAAFANNIGNVQLSRGKRAEAREHYLQALGLRERELGPEHPSLLSSLTNLGGTYLAENDADSALPLLERALAIAEGPGRDPVRLGNVLTNLAIARLELDQYAEARTHLERAAEIFEQSLGPRHPNLAVIHQSLGDLAARQRRWDAAEQHGRLALSLFVPAVGHDHPDVATIHESLARVLRAQDRPDEARASCLEAIRIRELVFDPDDRSLLPPLIELGELELELDDLDPTNTADLLHRAARIARIHPPSNELRRRLDAALARVQ